MARWKKNDVIAYLEQLVLDELADNEQLEMYEDYMWSGKLDKNKYTYIIKKLVRDMDKQYKGE